MKLGIINSVQVSRKSEKSTVFEQNLVLLIAFYLAFVPAVLAQIRLNPS